MKSSCPLRSRSSRLSSPRPRCLHLHSLLLADQRPKASSCAWVIRGLSLGPALCQGLETMQMQKTRGLPSEQPARGRERPTSSNTWAARRCPVL